MVELQFIAFDGIIATLLDVGEYCGYCLVQLRHIQMRTFHKFAPLTFLWISDDIHLLGLCNAYNIIFSIGVTRMPCAPISFSLPIISQNCFWSSTV